MTGKSETTTDVPLAERCPGKAVEEGADCLKRKDGEFRVESQHDSRCTLNAAGTDETIETSHSIVVHVPRDRARDFERAARDVVELGIEITKRDERGDEQRFVLRPYQSNNGAKQQSTGVVEL